MAKKEKDSALELLADEIYQDTIEDLEYYWDSAREENDPDILIDQIENHYSDDKRIIKYCKDAGISQDVLWDTEHKDAATMTFRDYLYEFVDAGIN